MTPTKARAEHAAALNSGDRFNAETDGWDEDSIDLSVLSPPMAKGNIVRR